MIITLQLIEMADVDMGLQVAGIYGQALRLSLRGAKFFPHPGRVSAEGPTR